MSRLEPRLEQKLTNFFRFSFRAKQRPDDVLHNASMPKADSYSSNDAYEATLSKVCNELKLPESLAVRIRRDLLDAISADETGPDMEPKQVAILVYGVLDRHGLERDGALEESLVNVVISLIQQKARLQGQPMEKVAATNGANLEQKLTANSMDGHSLKDVADSEARIEEPSVKAVNNEAQWKGDGMVESKILESGRVEEVETHRTGDPLTMSSEYHTQQIVALTELGLSKIWIDELIAEVSKIPKFALTNLRLHKIIGSHLANHQITLNEKDELQLKNTLLEYRNQTHGPEHIGASEQNARTESLHQPRRSVIQLVSFENKEDENLEGEEADQTPSDESTMREMMNRTSSVNEKAREPVTALDTDNVKTSPTSLGNMGISGMAANDGLPNEKVSSKPSAPLSSQPAAQPAHPGVSGEKTEINQSDGSANMNLIEFSTNQQSAIVTEATSRPDHVEPDNCLLIQLDPFEEVTKKALCETPNPNKMKDLISEELVENEEEKNAAESFGIIGKDIVVNETIFQTIFTMAVEEKEDPTGGKLEEGNGCVEARLHPVGQPMPLDEVEGIDKNLFLQDLHLVAETMKEGETNLAECKQTNEIMPFYQHTTTEIKMTTIQTLEHSKSIDNSEKIKSARKLLGFMDAPSSKSTSLEELNKAQKVIQNQTSCQPTTSASGELGDHEGKPEAYKELEGKTKDELSRGSVELAAAKKEAPSPKGMNIFGRLKQSIFAKQPKVGSSELDGQTSGQQSPLISSVSVEKIVESDPSKKPGLEPTKAAGLQSDPFASDQEEVKLMPAKGTVSTMPLLPSGREGATTTPSCEVAASIIATKADRVWSDNAGIGDDEEWPVCKEKLVARSNFLVPPPLPDPDTPTSEGLESAAPIAVKISSTYSPAPPNSGGGDVPRQDESVEVVVIRASQSAVRAALKTVEDGPEVDGPRESGALEGAVSPSPRQSEAETTRGQPSEAERRGDARSADKRAELGPDRWPDRSADRDEFVASDWPSRGQADSQADAGGSEDGASARQTRLQAGPQTEAGARGRLSRAREAVRAQLARGGAPPAGSVDAMQPPDLEAVLTRLSLPPSDQLAADLRRTLTAAPVSRDGVDQLTLAVFTRHGLAQHPSRGELNQALLALLGPTDPADLSFTGLRDKFQTMANQSPEPPARQRGSLTARGGTGQWAGQWKGQAGQPAEAQAARGWPIDADELDAFLAEHEHLLDGLNEGELAEEVHGALLDEIADLADPSADAITGLINELFCRHGATEHPSRPELTRLVLQFCRLSPLPALVEQSTRTVAAPTPVAKAADSPRDVSPRPADSLLNTAELNEAAVIRKRHFALSRLLEVNSRRLRLPRPGETLHRAVFGQLIELISLRADWSAAALLDMVLETYSQQDANSHLSKRPLALFLANRVCRLDEAAAQRELDQAVTRAVAREAQGTPEGNAANKEPKDDLPFNKAVLQKKLRFEVTQLNLPSAGHLIDEIRGPGLVDKLAGLKELTRASVAALVDKLYAENGLINHPSRANLINYLCDFLKLPSAEESERVKKEKEKMIMEICDSFQTRSQPLQATPSVRYNISACTRDELVAQLTFEPVVNRGLCKNYSNDQMLYRIIHKLENHFDNEHDISDEMIRKDLLLAYAELYENPLDRELREDIIQLIKKKILPWLEEHQWEKLQRTRVVAGKIHIIYPDEAAILEAQAEAENQTAAREFKERIIILSDQLNPKSVSDC